MGFFSSLLGKTKTQSSSKKDTLFALSTAYIGLEAEHNLKASGKGAIVFQPLKTADFTNIVAEMEAVVRGTGDETGTSLKTATDNYGYQWMIFIDNDVEDLIVGMNAVREALALGGYQDRVLCAVFPFTDQEQQTVYFIYNDKRGSWYPFVPMSHQANTRSVERELQLKALAEKELPIEDDLQRWFPLWEAPI